MRQLPKPSCLQQLTYLFSLITIVVLVLLAPATAIAQPVSVTPLESVTPSDLVRQKLLGQWQVSGAKSEMNSVTFTFDPAGHLYLVLTNASGSVATRFDYTIVDVTTSPMQLDVINTQAKETATTIFDFVAADQLRLNASVNPNQPRPKSFTSEDPVLQKVSDRTSLIASEQEIDSKLDLAPEPKARQILALLLRSQMGYLLDHQRFTAAFSQLGLSNSLNSNHYRYQITLQSADAVKITALPRQSGLKSYVAAVYRDRSSTTFNAAIGDICASDLPSTNAPVMPPLQNRSVACPNGSSRVVENAA